MLELRNHILNQEHLILKNLRSFLAEFVKNAKQYFGPRLTKQEIQLYMKTMPTLMQTDAGKKKVIENLTLS